MRSREAMRTLAGANPVRAEEVRELELSVAEDELLAAILAEPRERPPAAARRRVSRRPVLSLAVAALLVLVALVAGLPGGENDGSPAGLTVLDRVAVAAAEQPAGPELPNAYLKTRGTYVDTTVNGGEAWSTYRSEVAETWAAPDGSGLRRSSSKVDGFVSAADREAWQRAGGPSFLAHGWKRRTESVPFGPGTFADSDAVGADLSGLPTDPEELSRWLIENAKTSGNGFPLPVKTLTLVAELLQNPYATPQLRAALYEAEALVSGIEDLGPAEDLLGRKGVAVGARSANSGAPTVYSLIVDPDTSQVLATEQKQLEAPAALPRLGKPLVISSTAYLESRRTARIPSR